MTASSAHMVGSTQPRTVWPLVYALAGLQFVVTLGWMAYAQFQPLLLQRFGLTSFATPLAIYLGLVGATLAPVVGALSDRIARRSGSRISVVIAGGLLAAAAFVAVASTVTLDTNGSLRWLLLALIAVWVVAMTIFQAPALSLLPQSTVQERWPVAASPLVVATVLPTALWPFVSQVLDQLGGPIAFMAGGIAVVAVVLWLQRALTRHAVFAPDDSMSTAAASPTGIAIAVAFALGGGSAFITRLASEVVPRVLATSLGSGEATMSAWATATLAASSMFAPSIAPVAVIAGKRLALVGSIVVAVLCALTAGHCGSLISGGSLAMLLGATLAIYLDSALPYALESIPDAFGLGAGLYLGGVFAGSQLAGLIG